MSYTVDRKTQSQSEVGLLMPRLKSFALALTGSDTKALALLRATRSHALSRVDKDRGHVPLALWTLIQMQKIWAKRSPGKGSQGDGADPRLFQPLSRIDDGGPSARLAMKIARLSPIQRGILHLVYGERLSYDEAADIFEIPVSEIIKNLVIAHLAIGASYGQATPRPAQERSQRPFPYEQNGAQHGQAA
jgi:RNA polymerase sigma-70 factor (ECF subfamily)